MLYSNCIQPIWISRERPWWPDRRFSISPKSFFWKHYPIRSLCFHLWNIYKDLLHFTTSTELKSGKAIWHWLQHQPAVSMKNKSHVPEKHIFCRHDLFHIKRMVIIVYHLRNQNLDFVAPLPKRPCLKACKVMGYFAQTSQKTKLIFVPLSTNPCCIFYIFMILGHFCGTCFEKNDKF